MITPESLAKSGTEHGEQAALFCYAQQQCRDNPNSFWGLLFAIPNGNKRDASVAAALKAEGVKAGVPDIMLPVARGGYHGLFVEMKRAYGVPSDNKPHQRDRQRRLADQGYCVAVCYGWTEARGIIELYITFS
jgi:hypothetical protein